MTQDQSRAEFEAWWIVQGKYCRAAGGDYEMYLASQAWQAARAAAPSCRGCEEPTDQAETRMDAGIDRGGEVLPGVVVTRIELTDEQRKGLQADCDGPIPSAAPALPQAGWIPVSERLPEPFTDVIVHPRPTDYCCEAQVDRRGEWSYGVYEHYNGHVNYPVHVTHWMPLPQPPKEQGAPT